MPPAQKHRGPIIDAAVTLFRRQGYASTGLNDIVEASGAPKGSLYYYFPQGKASIAEAAVEEAGNRVYHTLEELSAKSATTSDLMRAHAALLAEWMESSDYRDGCPITTVLLELAPEEQAVTRAGRKAYNARSALLRAKLIEDGFQPPKAKGLAQLCTSCLQGSLIQARIERNAKPILRAAEELAEMLDIERERLRAPEPVAGA